MNSIFEGDCRRIMEVVSLEPLKNAHVVVTGSNGLLGSTIVRCIALANQTQDLGCKLRCLSLHPPDPVTAQLFRDAGIEFIQADLSQPFQIDGPIDFLFHAACYGQPKRWIEDKLKTVRLNVDAVRTLLEIARNTGARFMQFSSLDVYGNMPRDLVPVPETFNGDCATTEPRAAYGESKRLGETLCSVYRNEYQVDARIVRISHTYGPGVSIHDQRVLGNFIKMALVDREIRLLDAGNTVKTFGYVTDVIQMILKVMLEANSFIYNVGGSDTVTIKELADLVSQTCGGVPVIVPSEKANLEHIGTDQEYVSTDQGKLFREFGDIDLVRLPDGIRRTVDWNRDQFGFGN